MTNSTTHSCRTVS